MYSQSGGKGSAHAWLSDSNNIGAISYLVVQTHEYGYHRNFRTVHHAVLHMGTYALLPSDCFLRTLDATPGPTLSQDSRTLTLDDKHIRIFNELRAKLHEILMAVRALAAARKKGRGGMAGVDGMGGE
jgi:hypothetical protein